MKREEKNQLTRRRIMDSALAEFAGKGYGASSVNTICAAQDISKGIIYHYFNTKDELYLACVEECFCKLTEFLAANSPMQGTVEERLEGYFSNRMHFFRQHPVYQSIFCEAVLSPPAHLVAEIGQKKKEFDDLNIRILEQLLQDLPLHPGFTMSEVVETFRLFQDFINATERTQDFCLREERCKKALHILLFGVVASKKDSYER